ncbi:hypothetical protein GCM10022422_09120 [Flavobacterium ginsengisoli]|uniref:GtrA-like protein domain-containing protein n=1 Tax=Flavobacterium ginsengisoli TaxID=871694 RepID=A0ABP7F209_9FLAO
MAPCWCELHAREPKFGYKKKISTNRTLALAGGIGTINIFKTICGMNAYKEFWLGYAVSRYNQLKKYEKDPVVDIFMHVSFVQSVNLNTVLCLICKLLDLELIYYLYAMIAGCLGLLAFNFLWYSKLDIKKKEGLKTKKPMFSLLVYKLYSLFSTVFFGLTVYFLRQGT